MDFNIEALLKRTSEQVAVGDKTLNLRPLSSGHHQEFGEALKKLDFQAFMTSLRPVMEAFGSTTTGKLWDGITLAGPELLRSVLDLLGTGGGAALTLAVQCALDIEQNHNLLKSERCFEAEPEREHGVYITSPALRTGVRMNVTVPQAVNVLMKASDLTGYGEMGKALLGMLKDALERQQEPAVARTNAKAKPKAA